MSTLIMKKMHWALLAVSSCLVLNMSSAVAAPNDVLKNRFEPVADVSGNQAQIVYFLAANEDPAKGNANVYLDGEFQTALLPGSYTAFCVKPGQHTLGAWLKDDPLYKGKMDNTSSINVEGGKTYYFQAGRNTSAQNSMMTKAMATKVLDTTRLQNILLSRASSAEACQYTYKDYNIASDVMFAFGKSSVNDITAAGHADINNIASKIANSSSRIVVIGHTDPIGSYKSNRALGLKRAQTVRNLLIEAGVNEKDISADTAGSDDPIATGCEGKPRSSKISCYSPDRRVVIRSYLK